MTDSMVVDEIAEIVRFHAQIPPEIGIAPETRFAEDLGVDSFSMVCIVFTVREKYGLLADPDLTKIVSLTDLADDIVQQLRSRSSAA